MVAFAAFGGIRRVTRFTDVLVPIMAVIYVTVVLTLVAFNLERLPGFFRMVFAEAFAPDPIFGGALGLAISQGIKRGLMSNEAGQGTLTMPAAVADANHPCEQGCIQALGVFLDTIVICTLTGFVLIMGQAWLQPDAAAWFELGRLEKFLASVTLLSGGGISASGDTLITLLISVCFGTFAFTSLLGFMSFSEICVRQITTRRTCIHAVRIINLTVLAFGMATNLAGFDLSALWNLSDFANILMVCCNLPFLYLGFWRVRRALTHFEQHATPFNSQSFGEPVPVWDERAVRPAVVTGARS